MQEYTYNENSISSFFIEKINNDIIIISRGYENLFKYSFVINDIISKYYSDNNELKIYFDMLSYRGIENRFLKTEFKNHNLDIINIENLEEKELPINIQEALNTFYREHLAYVLKDSALSEYEKSLVDVA